ncbi:MAG: UbiD family decarboxylase [Phycisphaerales bacterium]|nr:UbiD family decarboxylase [Planctomycetota bacterium]MCH8508236.1 UbiD family decarboxylase [Phycisphaerales bacterium]
MYPDLSSFVAALESAGELVRVQEPVSPVLEIAKRADIASKSKAPNLGSDASRRNDPEFHGFGGPALLFEQVPGSDFPVLINAYGSYRRMEMAFGGRAFDDIGRTIGELVKPEPPRSLGEAIAKGKQFLPLLKIGPKRVKGAGACQEVIKTGDAVDLTRLGMLRCWEHDGDFEAVGYPGGINDGIPGLGHPDIDPARWEAEFRGRYITLAGIHTIHADDRDDPKPHRIAKSHNIGMYRVQLLGKNRLAMHWHMHHDGASHWRSWKKLGEPMPVAIALGGPSVMPYAATCPLPPGISELLMAGFLHGEGIRLCRAKTVPLWVPADAEIVIEGWVRTDAGYPGWEPRDADAGPLGEGAVFEGPFGDHTGFYSMPDRYPITEVSAVTHKRDAVYPTTIVGLPPQEDYYLGKATERIMLPLLKTLIPDIVDYDLPMFGAFHNCAIIQIRKHYPLHARKVMHAVWGAGQMAWTKTVIVVDEDVDCHDLTAVLAAVCRHCVPSRDIEQVHGALDILDHAAPRLASGMKIGFDATRKVAGEDIDGAEISPPRELPTGAERAQAVAWAKTIPGVLDAAAHEAAPGWMFIRADRGRDEPDREGLGGKILDEYFTEAVSLPFVVILGRDVDIHDHHTALFHWVANTDAGRDTFWTKRPDWILWPPRSGPTDRPMSGPDRVGFDATPKTKGDARNGQAVRAWPPVLPTVALAR